MNTEQVARICHETNRAYCETIGDHTQKSWADADQWQRDSEIKGVEFKVENPDSHPSEQHEAWVRDKVASGWEFGPVKDAAAKTHPCIIPYDGLPLEQRMKDVLFVAIVNAFMVAERNGEK